MSIHGPFNSGVAAGGAGVATANASTTVPLCGFVVRVYVKYNDAPPAATTDVVIATLGTSPRPPAQTILSVANAATDGWFFPQALIHVNTTGAAVAATYDWIAIDDFVNVNIAQADNGDSVDVWLLLMDY